MSELYTGSCRSCGQVVIGRVFPEKESADAWATEHCDCTEAREARILRQRIQDGCEQVERLFGEGCEAFGFSTQEPQEALELLRQLVEAVASGSVQSASVLLESGCKGAVRRTAKGKLQVSRSEGRSAQLEA